MCPLGHRPVSVSTWSQTGHVPPPVTDRSLCPPGHGQVSMSTWSQVSVSTWICVVTVSTWAQTAQCAPPVMERSLCPPRRLVSVFLWSQTGQCVHPGTGHLGPPGLVWSVCPPSYGQVSVSTWICVVSVSIWAQTGQCVHLDFCGQCVHLVWHLGTWISCGLGSDEIPDGKTAGKTFKCIRQVWDKKIPPLPGEVWVCIPRTGIRQKIGFKIMKFGLKWIFIKF